jgi:hypothetical protein
VLGLLEMQASRTPCWRVPGTLIGRFGGRLAPGGHRGIASIFFASCRGQTRVGGEVPGTDPPGARHPGRADWRECLQTSGADPQVPGTQGALTGGNACKLQVPIPRCQAPRAQGLAGMLANFRCRSPGARHPGRRGWRECWQTSGADLQVPGTQGAQVGGNACKLQVPIPRCQAPRAQRLA